MQAIFSGSYVPQLRLNFLSPAKIMQNMKQHFMAQEAHKSYLSNTHTNHTYVHGNTSQYTFVNQKRKPQNFWQDLFKLHFFLLEK